MQGNAQHYLGNSERVTVSISMGPKDVDPRELVWKGGSVLGKMEGVADLWVTGRDWVSSLARSPNRYSIIILPGSTWYTRLA